MADFVITTDNTTDFPADYYEKHQISYLKLSYILNDEIFPGEADFDYKTFYGNIRNGSMPTTSQVPIHESKEFFEAFLKEGKDILHIGFSSGLSGSYEGYSAAALMLKDEYPDRKIIVIDSLCASLGEGLLVHYAVLQKEAGKSIDEIAEDLESRKLHICHFFTVDDLNHLYRGGRVSRFSAMAGSLIGIKPILHVDNAGKLIPIGKVRGRKASLKALVQKMEEHVGSYKNDIVFISHGDSLEDAQFVQELVEQKFGIKAFLINVVGPVIGAHSGPGTIALFFMGENR